MLKIKGLKAGTEDKEILRGIDLIVRPGEVHVIMGPNGSGKSTLSAVIAGNENYKVTAGEIWFKNKNILELSPEERANEGIFLAFQYPVEIPGVSTMQFIKTALNEKRKYQGLPEIEAKEMLTLIKEKAELVKIEPALLNRSLNDGFSGGEKKRNEIFQMAVLEPDLAILDETDSGLDIDALKIVADGVNTLRNGIRSFLVITHYHRLLQYIKPDFVHVLYKGRIVKTGGPDLALELEEKGYDFIKTEADKMHLE